MARWEFKLPDIGEGVTEGEIVGWGEGVAIGNVIKADAPLVEVLTDKATVTITTPRGGTILELGGKVGDVVNVGANLVVLELAAGDTPPPAQTHGGHHDAPKKAAPAPAPKAAPAPAAPAAPAPAAPKPAPAPSDEGPAATAVGDIKEHLPGMGHPSRPSAAPKASGHAAPAAEASSTGEASERPLATPATRKLARDLGVDLRSVTPTGPNGRVSSDDVQKAAALKHAPAPAPAAAPVAAPAAAPAGREPIRVTAPSPAHAALETREPLRGVRKRIFEQMGRSKHTAAHFTFVEECDVTSLRDLRARLQPAAAKQGVKLSFLPFIIKAVVAALKKHPSLNSAYDESTSEIVQRGYYNIGIASSTDAGLMVPVVKDCDRRSLIEIAREVQRLADATKSGKVRSEDLQGSTFTVTSLGQQGGLFATPILNFPEVGILGVHQMKKKPVVRNDQIVIGEVMLLSLSFDHRLIDGHVGAAFAYEVIGFLEEPDRLFLET